MEAKVNIAIADLQNQKRIALENAEKIYQYMRDNERYSWAVRTINEKYYQLETDLIKSYTQ